MTHNEKEIARLKRELTEATTKYNTMKKTLESRLANLEAETAKFTADNKVFADEIVVLTPGYEELCKLFEERSKDYDEVRKKLIRNSNKTFLKTSLICS
jgi:hypothetical protein